MTCPATTPVQFAKATDGYAVTRTADGATLGTVARATDGKTWTARNTAAALVGGDFRTRAEAAAYLVELRAAYDRTANPPAVPADDVADLADPADVGTADAAYELVRRAGVAVLAVEPVGYHAARLTLRPGKARHAAAVLIQAGWDASTAHDGDGSRVLAVRPEEDPAAPPAEQARAIVARGRTIADAARERIAAQAALYGSALVAVDAATELAGPTRRERRAAARTRSGASAVRARRVTRADLVARYVDRLTVRVA